MAKTTAKQDTWLKRAVLCIMLLLVVTLLAMVVLYGPRDHDAEKTEPPSARVQAGIIRVVLSVTGFTDIYHTNVQISGAEAFTVSCGNMRQTVQAGAVWDAAAFFSQEEAAPDSSEIPAGSDGAQEADADSCTITAGGAGGLQVLSIARENGQPVYEGSLEVYRTEEGFVIVNELPVETYLRYVVPSEMPSTYGAEALKAQAVCARNFAWQHMLNPGYPQFDADLDDSIRFQVYRNSEASAETDAAIEATAGEVLTYEGALADAYYYSTSWGYTTDLSLWGSEGKPYYVSHWQGDGTRNEDLTEEATFARVLAEETGAYESGEAWYRWETTIPVERILENLRTYTDLKLTSLSDIVVSKRRSGGSVSELLLMGDGKPFLLTSEQDIRNCLLPAQENLIRNDGSVLHGYEKLPSSFFLLEKQYQNGSLVAVTVKGGGCGHGLGMSQNCAKALAARGMDYRDLLQYFFPGTCVEKCGLSLIGQ